MTRLSRRGFTLVELLVVIAIIGMLAALLIPAIQAARRSARRAQCATNNQNIGKAVLNFTSAKQRFPYLASQQIMSSGPGAVSVSWVPPLLPMMERNDLFQIYNTGAANTAYMVPISILICPEDTNKPVSANSPFLSYAVNSGAVDSGSPPFDAQENGIFFNQFKSISASVPPVQSDLGYVATHDGTSTTVMFSENLDSRVWQTTGGAPADDLVSIVWQQTATPSLGLNQGAGTGDDSAGNIARPSSGHGGGFFITYCDGHTQFMSQDVAYPIYAAIMTPFGLMARSTGSLGTAGSASQSTVITDALLNP